MIDTLLFDIDGVLTDGTVTIDQSGVESKRLRFDDIDALFELKRKGIRIGFLSGENNHFTNYVRERFAPNFFITGSKDKLRSFQDLLKKERLDASRVAYVGDSKKDVSLLSYLAHSFVPSNCDPSVLKVAKKVLKARRGDGVIREVVEILFSQETPKPTETVEAPELKNDFWPKRIDEHLSVIQKIRENKALLTQLEKVAHLLVDVYKSGRKLLICGNGGSASDAQHLAAELEGRFQLERPAIHAEALTGNVATMTAIGNDYTYDIIFARQVEAKGSKGDALIGLSTSGRSRNVIQAMQAARKKEMVTIGITGARTDTEIAQTADYCIHIPSQNTSRIQEAYLLIGHTLCEFIETSLFG